MDDPSRLPQAKLKKTLPSPRAGFVGQVDALGVALATLRLGGGRAKASDRVDPAVGVGGLVKVGDRVGAGDALCTIHASSEAAESEAAEIIRKAVVIGDSPCAAVPLVAETIG